MRSGGCLAVLAAAAVLTATAAGGSPAPGATRGTTWTAPVVLDGAGGTNGRVDARIGEDTAAVTYGGVAHVFYSASSGAHSSLRQATFGGPAVFETLDGEGGGGGRTTNSVGRDVSATVFGGAIHVLYTADVGGNLRHAWFDGSAWSFETLDGRSTVGGRVDADVGGASTATVFGGRLEVLYLDETDLDVRRASFDGATWTFSTLDGGSTHGGRTIHAVGFNLAAGIWGGALHVVYYEQDPAYGELLGWAREAVFDGGAWSYTRAFRVNTIIPGKTLALGVVGDADVYVAYNTTIQGDPRLRWRHWDGVAWSDSSVLTEILYGDVTRPVLFVVADGYPTLAFHDPNWGNANYFTWTGGTVTSQYTDFGGTPSSWLMVRGVPRIYWGLGDPEGCCRALLMRTSRP
jgi:hypothetical protein